MISEMHPNTQNSAAFSDTEKQTLFTQCIITNTQVWQTPLKKSLTQLKEFSCSRVIYLLVFQQLFDITCTLTSTCSHFECI